MTCATPSDGARRLRQRCSIVAVLVALLLTSATAEQARSEETPGDCLGIGFEVAHPVTIAKIIADQSQVRFVKSAYDDPACPADRDTCAQTSYLVPGDLALVGKTHGAYSCVSYQSAADRTQRWTVGWLRSASLTPVMRAAEPCAFAASRSIRPRRTCIPGSLAPRPSRRTASCNLPTTAARHSAGAATRPAIASFACKGLPRSSSSRTTAIAAARW